MGRAKSAAVEIELDLGRYELRREGRRVKIEKKPMELLIFLVARREQLISRDEIVAKLWRSDLFIDTEPNINNIVRKIRALIGRQLRQTAFPRDHCWKRLSIYRPGACYRCSFSPLR